MTRQIMDLGARTRLSRRLLLYVIASSLIFALLATAAQLVFAYRQELGRIEADMLHIGDSHVPVLVASGLPPDEAQMSLQFQGALGLPDIAYVVVTGERDGEPVRIEAGDPQASRDIVREFPLVSGDQDAGEPAGTLTVVASLDDVWRRLLVSAVVTLSTNLLALLVVAVVIWLIVQIVLTRHLAALAGQMQGLDAAHLDRAVVLERRSQHLRAPDELDELVAAINDLRTRLRQDIEQRQQAEQAARESEALLRSVVADAPEHILTLDRELRIEFANYASPGLTVEDLIGTPLYTYVRPERQDEIRGILQGVLDSGEPATYETVYHAPAETLYYESRVVARRLGGEIVGLTVMARDISDRKRAEMALQKSEARYRLLVENQSDLVVKADLEGRFQFVSPSYCRLFGKTEEELVGGAFMPLVHEEDREPTAKAMEALYEPPYRAYLEQRALTVDGWRWLGWMDTAVLNADGQVTAIIGVGRDITERVEAEQALQASEALHHQMFAGHSATMLIIDPYSGQIVEANPAAERFYGYDLEQLQQMTIDEINTLPADQIAAHRIAAATKETNHFFFEHRLADGRTRDVEVYSVPIEIEKQTLLYSIIHDITERRQAEMALEEYAEKLGEMVERRTRALRQAQDKLVRREKLAVLGQLAGGLGHELRNPLGVISNAVYYLRLVLADADETVREYLELIDSEVQASTQIVTDLLDFARGKPAQRQMVDLEEVVWTALVKCRTAENVALEVDLADDLPPVYVAAGQLQQVLTNLLVNGYQAMPEGGVLSISGSFQDGEPAHVRLAVRDTGAGISPEDLPHIFEPLYTTKARGIGLGLPISQNLIEANGGRIEVESEPGQGSTFTLWLPVA